MQVEQRRLVWWSSIIFLALQAFANLEISDKAQWLEYCRWKEKKSAKKCFEVLTDILFELQVANENSEN